MTRDLVVVDTESSGLDPRVHQAVEVAYWNLSTDRRACFVPFHNHRMVLHDADLEALRINGYLHRIVDRMLELEASTIAVNELRDQLRGATLVGANPAFDAAMLSKLFASVQGGVALWPREIAPWHHRLLDVSALAMGVLNLDYLPGLSTLAELLDIPPGDYHTAEGDVAVTVACFQELRRRASANAQAARYAC